MNENTTKKGNKIVLIIIIIGVLLLIAGVTCFFVLGNKDEKENKNETTNEQNTTEDLASKFEGIYKNKDSKLYIKKLSNNTFQYSLSNPGLFQGKANIEGNSAKENDGFSSGELFTFEYKQDGNIEVGYTDKESEPLIELGTYTKEADYNKENVYKYEVGDPKYLKSNYSGLYKNGDLTLAVIQVSEKEVLLKTYENSNDITNHIDDNFTIERDNYLVSKDLFDETKNDYEMKFNGKEFNLIVHDELFGIDEEDKKLEGTYKYTGEITEEKILKEFYGFF